MTSYVHKVLQEIYILLCSFYSAKEQWGVPVTSWTTQHPENWDTATVAEWITFTAEQYRFPGEMRRKANDVLKTYTGKQLLSMARSDFTRDFDDVGEILFTALKQVLDMTPGYKARSSLYAERIQALIESYQTGSPIKYTGSFWRSLDVRDWFKPDIVSWMNSIAEQYKMAPSVVDRIGEQISSLPGTKLYSMTLEDFRKVDTTYGDVLCRSLDSLKIKDCVDGPTTGRYQNELLSLEEHSD